MSDVLTGISLPNAPFGGLADWGRKSVPEMIAYYRRYAERLKQEAEAVLNAADSDFYVSTYRGVHVQRDRIVLQEGRKADK